MKKLINRLKRIKWGPKIKGLIIILIIIGISGLILPVILHYSFTNTLNNKLYSDVNIIPEKKVAIVFGAGLWKDGEPSDVLKDRVQTGVDLYRAGKVEKLLMSGDNRFQNYDEPSAMINYAKELGVPDSDLQPDYAGRRSYDTCVRAKKIFGIDEAILVTQEFHMTRTLYLCDSAGIDSIGMLADKHNYIGLRYMQIRDTYSFALALFDVNFREPEVVMGEKINLFD